MSLVGAFFLAALRAGGVLEGTHVSLEDRRVRFINCANRLLSSIQADFAGDLGSSRDCDAVVCVGAFDDNAPADLVRGEQSQTIVRQGWDGEWLTDDNARERLGL